MLRIQRQDRKGRMKIRYTLLTFLLASTGSLLTAYGVNAYGEQGGYDYSQPISHEQSSGKFFIKGDFLYWKPHVSGLELNFGTSSVITTTVDEIEIFDMEELDLDPHFKWDAGYRVGAGYQFGCSNWEISALWTHFQSKGTRSVNEDTETVNSGQFRIKFDQIDLMLGYNTSLTCDLTLKPFIGVRGATMRESLHAVLVTDITIPPDGLATETRNFDDQERINGIGPLLGVEGKWKMGDGFGFYGSAAVGLMYEKHKVEFDDTDLFTAPYSLSLSSFNERRVHDFNWNVDLAVGVSWETCICNGFDLEMKLGVEHHQYFNHSHLGTDHGDLSFSGGVFSISLAL